MWDLPKGRGCTISYTDEAEDGQAVRIGLTFPLSPSAHRNTHHLEKLHNSIEQERFLGKIHLKCKIKFEQMRVLMQAKSCHAVT